MLPWSNPPVIVAEALVGVPDPILTTLHPGPASPAAAVAASLARSLAPEEHPDRAPEWLLPEQESSFRRVLAAVRRHRGALLADPVGTGKTFIALAVAATMNRAATACLVPAALLGQWERAAAQMGVRLTLGSHEQISRGKLPQRTRGLVIIDESHHFRNPDTRRYSHLAPWLVGRPVLFVTATPIVNRLADLAHQLLLAVRDSALTMDGIVSIRKLLDSGRPAPALGQLVIESGPVTHRRPTRVYRVSRPTPLECSRLESLLMMVAQLGLSQSEPIAALIRTVLLRAAGSSPAALGGVLRRYRRLLLHAEDALRAGQAMDRAELRRFAGNCGDQLIWWELLPPVEATTEMELADLPRLEALIRAAESASQDVDGKLERLRCILADEVPTLVFTASRDTVRYLRDQLRNLRVAWCTGECAGIGTATMARRTVLEWFREPVSSALAPLHLVVTEVAAEGLDLQRAARVIHYDLPWTPMRLEQREGRSVRYGSRHPQVEVIRFAAPPLLERRLRLESALARKAKLPAQAGLGLEGSRLWRWRASLAEQFGRCESSAGVAGVTSQDSCLLAGFSLSPSGDPTSSTATVIRLTPDGEWSEEPGVIATQLALAAGQTELLPVDADRLKSWLSLLIVPLRERMALIRSRRWVTPDPSPSARQLASRLQRLIRDAARRHQAACLAELEQALAFVSGGHTAGETMLVERLARASVAELIPALRKLPKIQPSHDGIELRLNGLVVFGPVKLASPHAATPDRSLRPGWNPDRLDPTHPR